MQATTKSELVNKYFCENPQAIDEVMKATYAYHIMNFREYPGSHNFLSSAPYIGCAWCGRSRRDVRWDNEAPECDKRPQEIFKSISDVIKNEEECFNSLLEKAKHHIPKLVAKIGLSGKTLAILHSTYGYDPETVAGIIDVSNHMMKEYYLSRELESEQ